jgi:oxygen-independent coproporphyrinogen-3 oxidase
MDRYEVSNWARPGFECRYNLTVWAQGEYEGHGNGAHGYRKGDRYRNHRRLEAYIDRIESGDSPRAGADHIEGWEAELDRLFVGFRRTVGVVAGAGTEALLRSSEGRALLEAGVLELEGDRVRVARPLLTDAVHRSVLGLGPPIVAGDGNA